MDGKIEELKKAKRTLKTSITELLNELATECHGKATGRRQATG